MKLRFSFVAALAATLAVTSTGRLASAQSRSTSIYNNGVRLAANNAAAAEELPSRVTNVPAQTPPPMSMAPAVQTAPMSNGYPACGCTDGYYSSDCCDQGCCDDSGCGGLLGMGNGQFFFTADYLNVHASFSEADAFVREDFAAGSDQFIPMQFDYNSSYRVGGGWRSCCCGDQIRFMFTQLTSDASDTAFPGDIVPYETSPPPGGQTNISANVDVRHV